MLEGPCESTRNAFNGGTAADDCLASMVTASLPSSHDDDV